MVNQMARAQIVFKPPQRVPEVEAVMNCFIAGKARRRPGEQNHSRCPAKQKRHGCPDQGDWEPCTNREDGMSIAMVNGMKRHRERAKGMAEPAVNQVFQKCP